MTRPPITLLLLFLMPVVAYAIFVRIKAGHVFVRGYWRLKSIMTLATLGLLLMLGNLIYLAQFSGGPPGSNFQPARLEDGNLVPGRIR